MLELLPQGPFQRFLSDITSNYVHFQEALEQEADSPFSFGKLTKPNQ